MFAMGDAGSPYARFRRSPETGNPYLVLAAACELPQVALDDALRVCLVLRDSDPDRYERAAGEMARQVRARGPWHHDRRPSTRRRRP